MREIDPRQWFAWHPVSLCDTGEWAWLRTVWCRKEWPGPRTAKEGDPAWMWWVYYDQRPSKLWWQS